MVLVLKLMIFLVILQLTLASTIYSKKLDGNEEIVDTTIVGVDTTIPPIPGSDENNQVDINENTLRAVPGTVTPDRACGDATFDIPFIDATGVYLNLIAMVPEAVWNQDAIKNCQATQIVYCLPSALGDCKNPISVSSVPVYIVGSTGPDGNPNEYILDPSPFSAIAANDASMVAIFAA